MQSSSTAKRNFTPKDKQKLLANLDIEVEHRTKQLEAWLSDAIESFRSRNEGYLSRIPRIVLGVKMRDLEAKYDGDVLTCMKVLQMDRLAEGAAGVERSTKKRKWLATQDIDPERSDESSRANKNPRTSAATPRRMRSTAGYLSPTKSQLLRTPGTTRQARNIPPRPPFRGPSPGVRSGRVTSSLTRPASPSKISSTPQSSRRPPSSATFNPAISNGVPSYPNRDTNSLKHKGNSAWNPRYFGNAGELPGVREETECGGSSSGDVGPGIRRVNSITVRRQPSSVDFHSRPNPTAVRAPPDEQLSRLEHLGPTRPIDPPATGSLPARQPFPAQVQVTVPTVDGFFLEFNPLLVSPNALNELEGITEDAKKQAREEMVRLVKEAVSKWTI